MLLGCVKPRSESLTYLLLCLSKSHVGHDQVDQSIQSIIVKFKFWITQMACHLQLIPKQERKSILYICAGWAIGRHPGLT